MDYYDIFEKIKLNSIQIHFDADNGLPLEKGVSKFGGMPDLPPEFNWFTYTGESFITGEIAERPLSFLAQINCAEAHSYDRDNRLPDHGMLYFFYELETMAWGYSAADYGCARVYYYGGDLSRLQTRDFPENMRVECRLPEAPIHFTEKYELPDCEEFDPDNYTELWEEYQENLEDAGFVQEDYITKLLGYSDTIQGEMTQQCEAIATELALKNGEPPQENSAGFPRSSAQWKLLFQLDTVSKSDFELMFGDCGRIYFFIREDDLKNLNFDKTWLILQCG